MTPEQTTLVRSSFAMVVPMSATAGRLFYTRLFEIAPKLQPLFRSDIDEQSRKLMNMLAVAVGMLGDLPSLRMAVRDLGVRHGTYGVEPEHYAAVENALMWTLEQGLGTAFNTQTRAAWAALYRFVSTTMEPRLASDP